MIIPINVRLHNSMMKQMDTHSMRRLYMLGQRAKDMRWHIDKRVDDGIIRHPADSEE